MSADLALLRLHQLPTPKPDDPVLQLGPALERAGYREEAVLSLYDRYLFPHNPAGFWAVLRECRGNDALSLLVRLWGLSQWVDRGPVQDCLGEALVRRLCEWGLLAEREGRLGATVDISECQGLFLLTDHLVGTGRRPGAVYPVLGDSLAMARLTPRGQCGRSLDLCTGSGLHALLAARHSLSVGGVDLSERALDFAAFNATLNGLGHRCQWHQGSLFEGGPPARYDLILANPPWVPTPDADIELYRGGGEDGEALTSVVFQQLGQRLNPGGRLAMYVEYPEFAGSHYLDRVAKWLGPGDWGITLLNLRHLTALQYCLPHVASHLEAHIGAELDRWMDCYERHGIVGMVWAMIYVEKLTAGPGWAVTREGLLPERAQTWVGAWLDALNRVRHRAPRLDWHPDLRLFREADGAGLATWPHTCLTPRELSATLLDEAQRAVEDSTSVAPAVQAELVTEHVLTCN